MTGEVLGFIAGKMTPVLQLTDVAVAFGFKSHLEAVKHEVRREKRGALGYEAPFQPTGIEESACSAGDLMRILGRSWKLTIEQDEVLEPDRLLRQTRACG